MGKVVTQKKIIALAFTDIHLHRWKNFSVKDSRMHLTLSILDKIRQKADEYSVPLLFSGDFIHDPKSIDNSLLYHIAHYFHSDTKQVKMYGIDGNHDMCQKNSLESISPAYWATFSMMYPDKFIDLNLKNLRVGKLNLFGIPYFNNSSDLRKTLKNFSKLIDPKLKNILLIHTDLPGAKDAFGHVIDEVEDIKMKYFRKFDLVIDGHIHNPQKVGKKIIILGSPYQQTRSEKGLNLGYWKIYEDLSMKKVVLKTPRFIDLPEGEDIPDDGNYYSLIPKNKEILFNNKTFDAKLSRAKLAKRYTESLGIKEKSKVKALIHILNSVE